MTLDVVINRLPRPLVAPKMAAVHGMRELWRFETPTDKYIGYLGSVNVGVTSPSLGGCANDVTN